MSTDKLDAEDAGRIVRMIREAVCYLAMSPSEQWMLFATADPGRGQPDCPDELALGLGDCWAPNAQSSEYLNSVSIDLLGELDRILVQMSGQHNADLWSVAALDGPEWAEVRRVARSALAALGSS